MFPKLFSILALLLVIENAVSHLTIQHEKELLGVSNFTSAYFDPSNGVALKAELEEYLRNPSIARISYHGRFCDCEELSCSCCAGINLPNINFYHVTCTKFFFDVDDFSLNLSFHVDGRSIFYGYVYLRNPPPLCFPLPHFRFLKFCIHAYDLEIVNENLRGCINLETRLAFAPILVLHFNCVELGANGINWSQSLNQITNQTQQQVDEPVVYDDVDFEQVDLEVHSNYTSMLTPEEEAQIGQLKL